MRFSVIIPVYNKEQTIRKSVDSVLNQTYSDFELILVDDGSQDASVEILHQYNDNRIRIESQANAGPSAARNKGISLAKGDWIMFLDADDELYPNALEEYSSVIENQKDYDVIISNFSYLVNGNERPRTNLCPDGYLKHPHLMWLLGRVFLRTGNNVIKREVQIREQFNPQLRRFEDVDMYLRILRLSRVFCINQVLLRYNLDMLAASNPRKNISEDFVSCLEPQGKQFGEQLVLFDLYKKGSRSYGNKIKFGTCNFLQTKLINFVWFLLRKYRSLRSHFS